MQGQTTVTGAHTGDVGYSGDVPRKPQSPRGPRPKQGAHLVALRKTAGLTQVELAQFLGVRQSNIAFWEWSDKPPRSDLLPQLAKALGVTVDELLVAQGAALRKPRPGPVGEIQKVFEEVTKLPRRQQRKIIEMVIALVERYQKAS